MPQGENPVGVLALPRQEAFMNSDDDNALWSRVTRSVTPLRNRSPAAEPPAEPEEAGRHHPPPATGTSHAPQDVCQTACSRCRRRARPPPGGPVQVWPAGDREPAGSSRIHPVRGPCGTSGLSCPLPGTALPGRPPDHRQGTKGPARGAHRCSLRRLVPEWLNEPFMRRRIVALAPARPQHWGDGAYYLYLKKLR